jgi:hypothetical protein
MPDIQRVAQFVVAGNLFMAHKTAFTAGSLANKLLAAGFSDVCILRKGFDLLAVARKLAVMTQPRNHYKLSDQGGPAPGQPNENQNWFNWGAG